MNRRDLEFFYGQVVLLEGETRPDYTTTPEITERVIENLIEKLAVSLRTAAFSPLLTEIKKTPDGKDAQLAVIALGVLWQNDIDQPGQPVELDHAEDASRRRV